MAAREPTEDPTPRRLADARRRGEVAVSRDLISAAAVTAALAALVIGGAGLTARLVGYWRRAFAAALVDAGVGAGLSAGLGALARALATPLAVALGAALLAGLVQTRGLVAVGAVAPRFDRLSPAEGLRRLGSGVAALQAAKGALKGMVVALLVGWLLVPQLAGLTGLAGAPAAAVLGALGLLARRLVLGVGLVALALGAADLLFVRRAHRRRLRMTRDEVRREQRETEGDPRHRAERQRLHRQVLEQRMLADVRKADVVVVNPEHIAVALRYDGDRDAAPVVVASGEHLLAEHIKQVARQAGVPILRDVTLARSLRALPEGDEIPPALYEAVAEVIRVVQGGGGTPPAPPPSLPRGAGWKRA
ncbi:MAG TPA: EscU/YscU/HrcU family type III secretion system export apparatus switch protein [Polyangia bacterium]|nr:EscU/YscU/HrcU family type III secretion system export apparatus switch protein [Polyangia bacterium]